MHTLKEGQTIGIVAPARKVDEEQLLKGCEVIKSWGLKVQMGKHCFEKDNAYLAAPDESRIEDFQYMLDNPSIDAIFCARGGYGTTRIIDQLDFKTFLKKPKWIVGFSDITALHLKLYQLGIESIHGCMPLQFAKPGYEASVNSLKKILFSEGPTLLEAEPNKLNRVGQGEGSVLGGNLSLVIDSLGTSTEPQTAGCILVLEEIDELLYKIDRMFTQLLRAGKLSQLAGLVIGHMTDLKDTSLPFSQSVEEIVMNKVGRFNYPVAFNFPVGHNVPNLSWRHGGKATLSITKEGSKLIFS